MGDINALMLKGIEDGKKAFVGPQVVQLDLTGRCNNSCVGCWVHSPHIRQIKQQPRDKNVTLSFDKAKDIIEDLHSLGTREIILSGAGEPFLHPNILEIIELIKSKGIALNVITNFTLVDSVSQEKLVNSAADLLTVSIWAGTPSAYVKTHPGKTENDFYKIKDNLINLSRLKKERNSNFPKIKIYNVICSINCNEIGKMIDFALDAEAEFVEFQIMDIIDNGVSNLALSEYQVDEIKRQFLDLEKRDNLYLRELELKNARSTKEREFIEFPGRFMRVPDKFTLHEHIRHGPNKEIWGLRYLECRKAATFPSPNNPILDEENNKMIFKFSKECCEICPQFRISCLADENTEVTFSYLKILGYGSFMRRINSSDIYRRDYEKEMIDKLPCYAGWNYSRILSTGEVIPCCKAALKPLGNIYNKRFMTIWNSHNYREFRYKAKNKPKDSFYFRKIKCYKSCDNIGLNSRIKQLVSGKDEKERMTLLKNDTRISEKKIYSGYVHLPDSDARITILARNYKYGNLNTEKNSFGIDIVVDGGMGFGYAEYDLNFNKNGKYEIWSCYASEQIRPVELYFDDKLIKKEGLSLSTPGWESRDLLWFREAEIDISKGKHIFSLYTNGFIPHIYKFTFLKGIRIRKQITYSAAENIYEKPNPLQLLADKFKIFGVLSSSKRLLNYIKSGKLINNYLGILGVFNGSYAFTGPFHVQIDLTNDCNNNCLGCWCNSPLLEEKTINPVVKKETLPLSLIKDLLDELYHMGTKEIYFSGGGEPFMHPKIIEILAYAKSRNFTCYVNTNFTLLDKERILKLIDIGLDHLTVSTWAATPSTYALLHPNKSEETFERIRENLKFLNKMKRKTPYIKLYNVIFNLNYFELKEMVDFAKETGSESAEFTLIDTIPGKTEKLLLNPEQIKELNMLAGEIGQCLDSRGYSGDTLIFRFDSFLRRISSNFDLSKATYDRNIIDNLPCYIGFCFSRIMPNGDINACLKAHRIPTGNLYESSFSEIWNGEKQRNFRKKTLVYEKKDRFFRLIGNDPEIKEAGCYKSCDDIGRNIFMHNRLMSLTLPERILLKTASKVKQKPKLDFCRDVNIKDKVIQGIHDGRKAFVGPEQVVIDLTNRCNERCIACWLYSPLLKECSSVDLFNKEISFERAVKLIDELADLGTKRIRFTGGGEPFMHPKIMELIERVKSKGLICCLTSNFSLVGRDDIEDLIKLGVDELAVSIWASNKDTYLKTHPYTHPQTFDRIRENIDIIIKRRANKPDITLCNVICNPNCLEVEDMFRFAVKMSVDGIYFTLVDALEGTDRLLLNRMQRKEVLRQTEEIAEIWRNLPQDKKIRLDDFDTFTSRLKGDCSDKGSYDEQAINEIPCYTGWTFARILADGGISPCCRGVKKIMGNVNNQSFGEVWFSQKYNEFRRKAKYLPKTNQYFDEIGCRRMCDNLIHNKEIQERVNKKT